MSATLTTANLDFAKSVEEHRTYLEHLTSLLTQPGDMLLVQEAKKIRLRDLLPAGWATMQRVRSSSTRGSAVNWHEPLPILRARLRLGALPIGRGRVARMEVRRIAFVDRELNGHPITVVAAHYPPLRYRFLWPQYDRRLARLIRRKLRAGRQVIVGMDGNAHPAEVANRLLARGVRVSSVGDGHIDGFVFTSGLKVSAPVVSDWGIRNRLTDHPSVTVTVGIA